MTLSKRLELLDIDELLVRFEWLKDVDYVDVESITEDITYMIEAELDDDGDMVDIIYTHCSYRTSLRAEPDFWAFEDLRNGNYVCSL